MLTTNRTRLMCTKPVREGLDILDRFSVVALKENESAVKSKYESMGYTVTRVNL
jgi:hypothetical protein